MKFKEKDLSLFSPDQSPNRGGRSPSRKGSKRNLSFKKTSSVRRKNLVKDSFDKNAVFKGDKVFNSKLKSLNEKNYIQIASEYFHIAY